MSERGEAVVSSVGMHPRVATRAFTASYGLRARRDDFDGGEELLSRGSTTASLGRAVPEKVTRPLRSATRPGPTPRTRWNPSREPNGPLADRSLTMRPASTPPIRGSASISLSLATSRSTTGSGPARGSPRRSPRTAFDSVATALSGSRTHRSAESDRAPESAADRGCPGRGRLRLTTDRPLDRAKRRDDTSLPRAESTAAICRASAWSFVASDVPPPRAARTTRTLTPSTMTPARNNSALRSAGVGMAPRSHRRSRTESSVYSRRGSFYAGSRLCYTAGATPRANWLRSPEHRQA